MPYKLCNACRSITPEFWAEIYDLKEYCNELFVELQSFKSMRAEATKRGCQLCKILLESLRLCPMEDENKVFYLRRSFANPNRAVTLGTGRNGTAHISQMFFYRIPWWWSEASNSVGNMKPSGISEPVDNLHLLRSWIQACKHEHTQCLKIRKNFLPTRLLDVGDDCFEEYIKLVLSEKLKAHPDVYPEYLTLSHCWGTTHTVTTTTGNMKERMARIRVNDLSNTFRDAVQIVRKLGHRYLWIDSLCIVQNDKQDWEKEAALMAEVYGNSTCTLAALSSKDGTQGCNQVSNIQQSTNCSFFDIEAKFPLRIFQSEPKKWSTEYGESPTLANNEQSPLRFRAWVLQESELSPRTVFFAKNQLLWKCTSLKASAQLPWQGESISELTPTPWLMRDQPDEYILPGTLSNILPFQTLYHRQRWYELVEDYSLRSLTKETDKLPALSGLAKHNQVAFPDAQYIAGLWSTHLPAALLWQTIDKEASRHEEYTAPTWSWACIKGRISYDSQRLEPSGNSFDRPTLHEQFSTFNTLHFSHASIKLTHSTPYGAISHASITLHGAQIVAVDPPSQSHSASSPPDHGEPLMKSSVQVAIFYRDVSSESESESEIATGECVYCLRVRSEPQFALTRHEWRFEMDMEMRDTAMGLVLVKNSDGKYRRIGLARWVDEKLFERVKGGEIELV